MFIDGHINVRSYTHEDDHVPCTGVDANPVTLEVDGRPVLRGNRSRVVLVGGEISRFIDDVEHRIDIIVLRVSVRAGESGACTWTAPSSGRMHLVQSFGGDILSISSDGVLVPKQKGGLDFSPASSIEVVLGTSLRADVQADVTLVVEMKH